MRAKGAGGSWTQLGFRLWILWIMACTGPGLGDRSPAGAIGICRTDDNACMCIFEVHMTRKLKYFDVKFEHTIFAELYASNYDNVGRPCSTAAAGL